MRILAIGVALIVLGLAYVLDWPRGFGAHPWWSQDVVLYGAPAGIVLALAALWLSARAWVWTIGFFVACGVAFASAKWGQAAFSASFAEDAFAGRIWFFGWIAVALFGAASVVALVVALGRRT
jgi:hypothetical protein